MRPNPACRGAFSRTALAALGMCFALTGAFSPTSAMPPRDPKPASTSPSTEAERAALRRFRKSIARPAPADAARIRARRARQEALEAPLRGTPLVPGPGRNVATVSAADAAGDALTGTERVLVILVEFDPNKPDTFNWSYVSSTWDPFGKCNPSEYTGNPYHVGTAIAAQRLGIMYGVTTPTDFTYTGPLHNKIERPLSGADPSGDMIWTPDFSPKWYNDLIFGNGVKFQYNRQDGSQVDVDFTGKSVRNYYEDISGGRYSITGQVVGWVKVPHSVWWYGADPAPGSRSGVRTDFSGGIPGAGNAASLVRDALDAVNTAYPGFNWKQYDLDGDDVIDRLWIIHSGLGEEDSPTLLNRTDYGEGGLWSHSGGLPTPYTVYSDATTTVKAGPYIMMPENCGIAVLAHEYAHNLGAEDLYAYGNGNPSTGFWSIMCDSWTGFPVGFEPSSMDPWHLDNWGWLEPALISDPTRVYKVNLGQASHFPTGTGAARGAKILLPEGKSALPVKPENTRQWWGGNATQANSMMTLRTPVAIPAAGATLSFRAAWDIETGWDFVWVQASSDGGSTWKTLTNAHTTSAHDPSWIGGVNGFPDDLAAAGIGGLTGKSAAFPAYQAETFSLAAFAGQNVLLRFWYMTDWGYEGPGFFMDDVRVEGNGATLLADSAAANSGKWTYAAPWQANDGFERFTQNYYLQWRNASPTGGYDRTLSDPGWYFAPVNSGMVAWYNNNFYKDNEVYDHLFDQPSFGPKGRMLVVDAHPEPYRDSYWVNNGYANEAANLTSRSQMRDAPFSLIPSVDFRAPFTGDSSPLLPGQPAVSEFSDALGWYPGAEKVRRGPGYPVDDAQWITKEWDASVVVPATAPYGPRAPGYTAAEDFRYAASIGNSGTLNSAVKNGLGVNGGTGNPSEVGGQYGWNAKILSQTDTGGTVVVWNARYAPPVVAVTDRYTLPAYGQPLSVAAPGILANDTGPGGWETMREVVVVIPPAHGTLSVLPTGAFTYTPAAGYVGSDRFAYRVRTAYGAISSTAVVSIGRAGDADRSGAVNMLDVRLALRIAGGLVAVSEANADMGNTDLNRDGRIASDDVSRILRIATGMETP